MQTWQIYDKIYFNELLQL